MINFALYLSSKESLMPRPKPLFLAREVEAIDCRDVAFGSI